jgi:ribosomal protein L11 methyltransferase
VEAYWCLSIELPRRHLEALSSRLFELGFPSFEERLAPRGVAVVVYAAESSPLERLRVALRCSAASGELPAGELGFQLAEVAPGWALEWTKHLEPVALTATLTLHPRRPVGTPAEHELYLEPAFAFGFGEHESTRLAARWLEAACRRQPGRAVLDIGCGTGVLALVASRCGAGSVLGIDVSEPAILAARSNAALNGIERGVAFELTGVEQVSAVFDYVVANIEAGVLCELAADIVNRVAPGGELGLAGFITEQQEAVARRYASEGLRLELRDCVDDWCLLIGKKEPNTTARACEGG